MMASGKLKTKFEMGTRELICFKEHAGPSGSRKSVEEKMDEMGKIIKDLSKKISWMEREQAKLDSYVRNQFRRNPNPQIQQRKIKNEDQKIQAPFKTENFMQRDEVQDYEELEEDLNNFGDDDLEPHLTKQDYEKSLDLESLFNNDENINNLGDSTYKGLIDSIMIKLQHKYDLRPCTQRYHIKWYRDPCTHKWIKSHPHVLQIEIPRGGNSIGKCRENEVP
jgi:hypothetical protein